MVVAIFVCVLISSQWYGILWRVQKREREFDDFIQERLVQAKADLRELLKETKLITYKYETVFVQLLKLSVIQMIVWAPGP